ncbi:alpha/beta hydrolase [Chryseolinea lacunae]|uniref:Alpha/beta hydrolase n=1 Tax=Chryseolinea lacunae TaxID=2801331 RepID=A0ABS1KN32_9BACT|nr:alpha/beta hydrolase [Chryseolinea lacunae]MBL0740865.1 alpha/beta hydrolase [Chryseolinea lacunae]
MDQHHVAISYRARYFTLGTLNSQTRQIWFVLHGYGQLAEYFLKNFSALEQQNIFVVAPEGLSRFYTDSLQPTGRASDRVGATWMTKEDRLTDIQNYLSYLNTVYATVVTNPNLPVTVLGFSQGAATASRWVVDGKIKFDRFILWAGVLPPDMNVEVGVHFFEGKEVYFVHGTADPFLNDSRFEEMKVLTARLGITPKVITFEGKHQLHTETLLTFA